MERTRIHLNGRRKISNRPSGMAWAGWGERFASRSLGDYGADFRALWDSEYSQVWRRCLMAGLPITLNGRAINRPFLGKPKSLTSMKAGQPMKISLTEFDSGFTHVYFVIADRHRPGLLAAPTLVHRSTPLEPTLLSSQRGTDYRYYKAPTFPSPPFDWTQYWLSQQVFSSGLGPAVQVNSEEALPTVPRLHISSHPCMPCQAMLAKLPLNRFSDSLGWLALVQDGVVITKVLEPRPGLSGWCIVASAQGLETDLSQFNVLDTPAYQNLLDCLEQICALPG